MTEKEKTKAGCPAAGLARPRLQCPVLFSTFCVGGTHDLLYSDFLPHLTAGKSPLNTHENNHFYTIFCIQEKNRDFCRDEEEDKNRTSYGEEGGVGQHRKSKGTKGTIV
jgi:hypothetical protein